MKSGFLILSTSQTNVQMELVIYTVHILSRTQIFQHNQLNSSYGCFTIIHFVRLKFQNLLIETRTVTHTKVEIRTRSNSATVVWGAKRAKTVDLRDWFDLHDLRDWFDLRRLACPALLPPPNVHQ